MVEGRLFYSYEDVLIDDIELTDNTLWMREGDSAYNEQRNEIERTISKVGFSLSRDTRDVLLFLLQGV